MNIGEYSILHILSYFIIYSFFGWGVESIYRSICEKKIINTGFLYGPVCPIYGIAAVTMVLTLENMKNNIILLFITSFFVLSIWEYIVGVLLEKIFERKYWDYSNHKLNIKGRVCLLNSIYWGILGTVFVLYIHPFIQDKVNILNINLLIYLNIIIYITFAFDVVKSIINHKTIAKQIEKLEEMTKQIKEKLVQLKDTKKEQAYAELRNTINDMKYEQMLLRMKLFRRVIKIKKAFPTMQSEQINKLIMQKIQLKKLRNRLKNIRKRKEIHNEAQ